MSLVARQPHAPMTSAAPRSATVLRADVVICTYTLDRWDLLVRAVESALAQTIAPQQLIIVVGHAAPGEQNINEELLARCRQEWGTRRGPVEIVVATRRFAGTKGSSLNTALLLTGAEIIAFLDDDAEAAPDWLERKLEVYSTYPEIVAVGGAPLPDYGAPRPPWFPPDFDWVFGCHYRSLPDRLAPTPHLIGTSMSVRRDAILSVGGFHADWHDDMDLSHRIAHSFGPDAVCYEPRAQVLHYVPPDRLTWSYFWRRCFYVNRSKVSAFANMGEAGNIGAELRFAVSMLLALGPALLAAVTGRPERLRQAVVAVAGVALAGCGYVAGRVQVARGHRTEVLTTGLSEADIHQAHAAARAAGDA